MPNSFDALVTALQQRPSTQLTLELVKAKLLTEAEKRRERSGSSAVKGEKALEVEYRPKNSPSRHDGGANSGQGTREYFLCYNPGHLKRSYRSQQKASGRKADEENHSKDDSAKAKQVQNVLDGPLAWITGKVKPSSWFVGSVASKQ